MTGSEPNFDDDVKNLITKRYKRDSNGNVTADNSGKPIEEDGITAPTVITAINKLIDGSNSNGVTFKTKFQQDTAAYKTVATTKLESLDKEKTKETLQKEIDKLTQTIAILDTQKSGKTVGEIQAITNEQTSIQQRIDELTRQQAAL